MIIGALIISFILMMGAYIYNLILYKIYSFEGIISTIVILMFYIGVFICKSAIKDGNSKNDLNRSFSSCMYFLLIFLTSLVTQIILLLRGL